MFGIMRLGRVPVTCRKTSEMNANKYALEVCRPQIKQWPESASRYAMYEIVRDGGVYRSLQAGRAAYISTQCQA